MGRKWGARALTAGSAQHWCFLGYVCQHETASGRSRRQAKGIPTSLPLCAGTPNPCLAVNKSWFSNCIKELVVVAQVYYISTRETGEEELREFEVNLGFLVSSRIVCTSEGDYVSENK